ncbi:lipopolysaccharide biosynthesis protein [Nesterenkonia lutea]|uniref:O-antigen/teichoic acid export membrane protein n=1 Tax=Nesterenkonia lutea TaxID=272919 RepID=A0ABR9JCU8_9MICC|nr:hypothetical protein [Nesterenkonia lutea]MBE1523765.1 O-antigen/teichoic acid export membrane protein [Nesterenkonia lutea]
MLLRTAGMRAAVLPISGICALTSAGLTVQYAGVLAFGFIIMIAQLQIALPFADLGLGAAVARAVARAGKGHQSVAEVRILIRRTALVLGAVGISGATAATLAGVFGLWSSFFRVPDGLGPQVDLVMSLVLCIFFLGLPMGLAARVLVGRDRSDLLVLLGLIPPVGNLLAVLILIEVGVAPIWLAVGLPVSTVTYVAICASLAFLHPRIGVRGLYADQAGGQPPRSAEPDERFLIAVRLILIGGLPVLLSMAGRALSEQHGRLVLARVATAADVSEYAMALQLYMPIYSVLFMSAMVLWPRFAVKPDVALWRRANAIFLGLGLSAALGFALLARPVSDLVTGGDLVPSWGVVLGMAAALVAQSIHLTQTNLFTDRRGFWLQAAMSSTLLALVIPGTILGVQLGLGAAAPGISLAAGVIVAQAIPGLIMAHRLVSRPPQDAVPPNAESAPTQRPPVPAKGDHRESPVLQPARSRS